MGYVYPVGTTNVSDDFEEHKARGSVNPGTDYTSAYGSPVYAPNDGVIVGGTDSNSGSGGRMTYMDLDDGNGIDLLHLSSRVLKSGWVKAGTLVAYSGASGNGSDWYYGPHLHISIRNRHGSHTTNAGNFDFDAMMKAAPPAVPRGMDDAMEIFMLNGSSPALFAIAGGNPGTPANWRETTDLEGIVKPYLSAYKPNYTAAQPLSKDTWDAWRNQFLSELSTDVEAGTGGGGPSADTIANAVDAKLADNFDALPTAPENATATVDLLGDRLDGEDSGLRAVEGVGALAVLVLGIIVVVLAVNNGSLGLILAGAAQIVGALVVLGLVVRRRLRSR